MTRSILSRSRRHAGNLRLSNEQERLLIDMLAIEPRAYEPTDTRVARLAQELIAERLLGEVQIGDRNGYRLTEFGRAAALGSLKKRSPDAA